MQNSIYLNSNEWWNGAYGGHTDPLSADPTQWKYQGWNEVAFDANVDYADNIDKLEALVVALQSGPAENLCELDDDALQSLDNQLSKYWADAYGSLPVVIMKTVSENNDGNYQKEVFLQEYQFASGRCIKDIDGSGTLYYYGGDNPVECIDATNAPVSGPVATPVASPTEAPTTTPVDSPVVSPTKAPDAPVAAPTEAPTVTPVTGPTDAPDAPVITSTEAPTATPVVGPTDAPNTPVAPPTELPTATPVVAPTDTPDTPVAPPHITKECAVVGYVLNHETGKCEPGPDTPTSSPAADAPDAPAAPPAEQIDSSGTAMATVLAFAAALVSTYFAM